MYIGCEAGWNRHGDSCYRYFTQKSNWIAAKDQCVEYGANLVIINTNTEIDFIISLTRARTISGGAWIGLKCIGRHGAHCFWVDNSKFDFTKWHLYEPNGDGSCIQMRGDATTLFENWNDLPCSYELAFFCEKPLRGKSRACRIDQLGIVLILEARWFCTIGMPYIFLFFMAKCRIL